MAELSKEMKESLEKMAEKMAAGTSREEAIELIKPTAQYAKQIRRMHGDAIQTSRFNRPEGRKP